MKTDLVSSISSSFSMAESSQTKTKSADFSKQMGKAQDNLKTKLGVNDSKTQSTTKKEVTDTSAESKDKVQTEEEKVADKTASKKESADEKKVETENVQETQEVQETLVDDEVKNAVMSLLAEQLNVSIEELQDSMQKLNLNISDLQDSKNLIQLIVDVKGLSNPMELLTDPKLAATFKEVSEEINELMTAAAQAKTSVKNVTEEPVMETKEQVVTTEKQVVENETTQTVTDMQNHTGADADAESKSDRNFSKENHDTNQGQVLTTVNTMDKVIENVQEVLTDKVDEEMSTNIMKQITDAVKLTMKSDVTSLEMQLYPEHLGKISIQVAAKNGVMTAQIAAENETAKIAVESQIDILKQSLQEQGLKVESIEVMVSTKGFDQEKGNNHSQESEKNKNRRVRKDILEELTKDQEDEEDESVKETLGNTVSFTA